MRPRGVLVSAEIKRKGLRKVVEITLTDGRNELKFTNCGSFEIETVEPMSKPLWRGVMR